MYIYICIGTIPLILLGIFFFFQERGMLIEKERQALSDALNQGVNQMNSQILVYNNLSDYIAFNQPVAEVLGADYTNSYEMYEQYTDTVDPVLSSLKYFNPNINQITIYLDRSIVQHEMTVAPMSDLAAAKWYQEQKAKLSQTVQWIVSSAEKRAFSVRKMPILEQNNIEGILYLDVNYNDLFGGFSDLSQDGYGLYIVNKKQKVIYCNNHFRTNEKDKELTLAQLLRKKEALPKGKNTFTAGHKRKYMLLTSDTAVDDWQVILYRPVGMVAGEMQLLGMLILGIIAICIITSLIASQAFSFLVVRDIERLRDNMQAVENGDMQLTVTSDAQDEVGGLVRGFGSMLAEINRLIHEVYEGKLTLRKMEMTALQAQINPHFLYNSLSLINWKALEAGQEDISQITLALSSFYRTSLNRGKNVLTIEKELENMRSYLKIQSCMHDDDFDVAVDVDESILPYKTLNLLLQPLVENAIDHGIDLKEEGRGYIKIIGRKDENNIYLTVEDNGVGIEPDVLASILEFKTRGYGVRNVNERIKLYYGEPYCLRIESEVGKGTKCIITIPKQE